MKSRVCIIFRIFGNLDQMWKEWKDPNINHKGFVYIKKIKESKKESVKYYLREILYVINRIIVTLRKYKKNFPGNT